MWKSYPRRYVIKGAKLVVYLLLIKTKEIRRGNVSTARHFDRIITETFENVLLFKTVTCVKYVEVTMMFCTNPSFC